GMAMRVPVLAANHSFPMSNPDVPPGEQGHGGPATHPLNGRRSDRQASDAVFTPAAHEVPMLRKLLFGALPLAAVVAGGSAGPPTPGEGAPVGGGNARAGPGPARASRPARRSRGNRVRRGGSLCRV